MKKLMISTLAVMILAGPTFGDGSTKYRVATPFDNTRHLTATQSVGLIVTTPLEPWTGGPDDEERFLSAALDMLCGETPRNLAGASPAAGSSYALTPATSGADDPVGLRAERIRGLEIDLEDESSPLLPYVDAAAPLAPAPIPFGAQVASILSFPT